MADTKISALPASTTPLAGTEVLPIVQGGATRQVSVENLTAGRAVATAGGSFTDNITQSVAAKGLNFAANTPAAGMTSQLLNWYEEGTWGGVNGSLNISSVVLSSFTYTRVGRQVTLSGRITGNVTSSASTTYVILDTLPFPIGNSLTVAGSCHTQNNTAVGIALGNNANSIYVWFTATSGIVSGSQGFALTITYFI
jgi:hypothetical protein